MLISINLTQVLNNKTISRQPDGSFKALRSMFGIVPDDLDTSLAAKETKATFVASKGSADLDEFLVNQEATKRVFQNISIPAGVTLVPREPVKRGDTVYKSCHGGSLYAHVDEDVVVFYSSLAERKAAQKAAIEVGA